MHNRSLDELTGEWSEAEVTWSFARTLCGSIETADGWVLEQHMDAVRLD